jgi:hypothetical protein
VFQKHEAFSTVMSFMSLLALSFAADGCQTLSGLSKHSYLAQTDICLSVTDSFFANTTGVEGGALLFFSTAPVSVSSTTFLGCIASALFSAFGGALDIQSPQIQVSTCCFRETGCDNWGTAVEVWQLAADSRSSFSQANFVACFNTYPRASATINIDSTGVNVYQNLNFTQCRLSVLSDGGLGVVLRFSKTAGSLRVYECTVLSCSGVTGIHSFLPSHPQIQYCNFYLNTLTSGQVPPAVLYGETSGMSVSNCIFYGNTAELRIEAPGNLSALLFSVSGCVFSGDFPVRSIIAVDISNLARTHTNSIALPHFHTYYCPTASPARSRTVFPTPTRAQTAIQPSMTPGPSSTPAMSRSPTESIAASETPTISQTWYCEIYTNAESQLMVSPVFCVSIASSLFVNMSSTIGGGILIEAASAVASIVDTTFHVCQAISGGAMAYGGGNLSISACCMSFTSSFIFGTSLYFIAGEGSARATESTIVRCFGDDRDCAGTISQDGEFDSSWNSINFTSCSLLDTAGVFARAGCILSCSSTTRLWSFQYCSATSCSGISGIASACERMCDIDVCVFVNNRFPQSSALLVSSSSGVSVSGTIFKYNTPICRFEDSTTTQVFRFSECVFSEDDSAIRTAPWVVLENAQFVFEPIIPFYKYLDTHYCPAEPPSATFYFTPDIHSKRPVSIVWRALIGVFFFPAE